MNEITNAVIVERIDGLKEHFSEALERIEKQTIKTNGRVSSLERWRSYLAGATAVILFLITFLYRYIAK